MDERLKELENNFKVLEAVQLSSTSYDKESQEATDGMKVEDEKSYEDDKLDLEEILSQTTNFKKNYIKKVVNTVNKLIDGTADIEDLTKAVKGRKKKQK